MKRDECSEGTSSNGLIFERRTVDFPVVQKLLMKSWPFYVEIQFSEILNWNQQSKRWTKKHPPKDGFWIKLTQPLEAWEFTTQNSSLDASVFVTILLSNSCPSMSCAFPQSRVGMTSELTPATTKDMGIQGANTPHPQRHVSPKK